MPHIKVILGGFLFALFALGIGLLYFHSSAMLGLFCIIFPMSLALVNVAKEKKTTSMIGLVLLLASFAFLSVFLFQLSAK
jgi:hypothetical protein